MFHARDRLVFMIVAPLLAFVATTAWSQAPARPKGEPAKAGAAAAPCFACHAPIKEFHASGKHKDLGCTSCHDGVAAHVTNVSTRPTTTPWT